MQPKIKKPKVKAPTAKSIAGSMKKKFGTSFIYVLIACVLSLLVSYIIAENAPSRSSFLQFQVYMFVLGIIHCLLIFHWLKIQVFTSLQAATITIITLLFMLGLSYWNMKIPLFAAYPTYYAWGVFAFVIPWLAMICFEILSSIPQKVYRKWYYPYGKEVPIIEVIEPQKLKFYISLQHSDEEYNEFSLNVPMKYKVGEFLHYFIHRYNYDKNPQSPIFVSPDNSNEHMYGWLFTTKGSMGKQILDPDKTFAEQGVKENASILIDRYFTEVDPSEETTEIDIIETHKEEENEG